MVGGSVEDWKDALRPEERLPQRILGADPDAAGSLEQSLERDADLLVQVLVARRAMAAVATG